MKLKISRRGEVIANVIPVFNPASLPESKMTTELIIDSWDSDWNKECRLGGGAQGTTFLLSSKHRRSDRAVLKTLNNSKSEQARIRFHREILSLIDLACLTESVPKVIAHSDETAAKPFFIMDYVSGETLQEYISRQGALSLQKSVEFFRQLCETIRIAHRIPILHRDLKPDNIIVRGGSPETLSIVDFGLAYTSNSSITELQETFRNRFLLLPEMAAGGQDKRDHRSDITSLVAILYFCLTGRAPGQLLDATGRKPHRVVFPTIDTAGKDSLQRTSWLAFFDKGFEYKLEERFQSIDEMVARLDAIGTTSQRKESVSVEQAAENAIAQLRAKNHRQFWIDEQKPKLEPFWRKLHQYFDSNAKRASGFRISSFSGGAVLPTNGFECQYAGGFILSVDHFSPAACIRHAVGFLDRDVGIFVAAHRNATNQNLHTDPSEIVEWRAVARCSPDDLALVNISELDEWISGAISDSIAWIVDAINSPTEHVE